MDHSRMKRPVIGAVAAIAFSGFYLLAQGTSPQKHVRTARSKVSVFSHTRKRLSENGAFVSVTITPLQDVLRVDPNKAPSADLHIANLSNAGPTADKFFKMKPSDKATYQLFAVPQMDKKHHATRWKLVEIDRATGKMAIVKKGWIHDCKHGGPPEKADADFLSCDWSAQVHPYNTAKMKKSDMMSGVFLHSILALIMAPGDTSDRDPNDPPWISCTTGCCTLEQ